jgi:hypothetical protein
MGTMPKALKKQNKTKNHPKVGRATEAFYKIYKNVVQISNLEH